MLIPLRIVLWADAAAPSQRDLPGLPLR